jgi:hypothetical protein
VNGGNGSSGTSGLRGVGNWTPLFSGGVDYSGNINSNTFAKLAGNDVAWDGQVYSLEGYARGCYVSFQLSSTANWIMLGLGEDPTTSPDYVDIEFAWYPDGYGNLNIYENGGYVGAYGTYTTSTVLAITYDGFNVRYWKDGVLQRTVARAIGNPLYLDSSFYRVSSTNGVTNCVFGPMGEAGTSGVNGVNGTSGTSGINGTNGTSGTSGTRGTSGTSGDNGAPGASGTSGTSGVDGAGGCDTEHMLIASHSGSFQEDGNNDGSKFWIGEKTCGWDSCALTILQGISEQRVTPINISENNVGIMCPMDLAEGDSINLCGIAYTDGGGGQFGAAFGFFSCNNYSSGEYPLTPLAYDITSYSFTDSQTCWNVSYTLGPGEVLHACSDLFVVGMNAQGPAATIKFSYTFMITRNCTPV